MCLVSSRGYPWIVIGLNFSRDSVIRKRAERLERKRMQKYKVNAERLFAFEELLNEIYTVCRPKSSDYEVRRDLISVFNEIEKDIYGCSGNVAVVEEFGSFVMDLFHSTSDLVLSVNFDNSSVKISHEKKIQTLRKFARKLYALQRCGHVSGVHPITAAKMPILKVVDCSTRIECDISVENRDGVSKSKIIHMICSLDERFQKLSFLMKAWAKAQNINSSRDKTLNSLSVILLFAFHLQLLSVEKVWAKGLCASTYEASWLSKTWDSKVCCISVEDFTDRSQNVARAVGKAEVKHIYKCIQRTSEYISAFMDGLVEIPTLKYQLFGRATPFQDCSETRNIIEDGNTTTLPCRDIKKPDQSKESQKGIQSAIPSESITTKRKWSIEGWEGLTSVSCGHLKSKWSTEGWEGVHSVSWGQPKEDGGPPDSPWSKGKWSTKGWGKASSANWGHSNGDNVPPDSIWTKRKKSDETRGGTSSSQWLGKLDTKSWPKRKHNNKHTPKAKWSKM